jgi:hypothetical protein
MKLFSQRITNRYDPNSSPSASLRFSNLAAGMCGKFSGQVDEPRQPSRPAQLMKLDRLAYEPGAVLDFYEEGLTVLGSLCERTWHDRLELVAEGRASRLWNDNGALHSGELHFAPADATTARDAAREVFPGCPLTFRLAEVLRPSPLALDRVVLAGPAQAHPPDPGVAEKLWRGQFPDTTRWRLAGPFKADFHFSLVALARCEIQAIDQHWSLHRLAVALPGGQADESLAREISFAQPEAAPSSSIAWPASDPARWSGFLQRAIEQDLADELAGIRARQENSLRRELDRVDDYFENYAHELAARAGRSASENVRSKTADRLAAAKAEHARRRADQVARHEIRICPHLDALLLIAEPAWRTELQVERTRRSEAFTALFVPRARRWESLMPPDLETGRD